MLTGLADGLALKESRPAIHLRFAPTHPVPPFPGHRPRGLSGVDGRDPSRPPGAKESHAARKMRRFRSAAVVVARLLLDRPLGPRDRLEAVVGNRLAALHRQAVGAEDQTLLGALDRGQLLAQAAGEPGVALLLEQLGAIVGHVLVGMGELLPGARSQLGQRLLEARALHGQQLGGALRVHGYCRPATFETYAATS